MKSEKKTFFKPKVPQRITNLDWKQSKVRFPLIKPYGDADFDGVKNCRDCKPFNIRRQGEGHNEKEIAIGFGEISQMKTIGDIKELEESFLNRGKND